MEKKTIIAVFSFAALFCVSFFVLFTYFQKQRQATANEPPIQKEIPLPEVSFSDISGNKLPDEVFRTGKVVLMFVTTDCNYCGSEAVFVNELVVTRNTVKFYGVISIGDKQKALTEASAKFPMHILFDDSLLAAKS